MFVVYLIIKTDYVFMEKYNVRAKNKEEAAEKAKEIAFKQCSIRGMNILENNIEVLRIIERD